MMMPNQRPTSLRGTASAAATGPAAPARPTSEKTPISRPSNIQPSSAAASASQRPLGVSSFEGEAAAERSTGGESLAGTACSFW